MEYKVNLTDEEEKLFLQVVGTRLEHVQKTLSDMEKDVQNDKTGNLKKLQDEFRTHESVLMKFMYGEDFSSGFSRYVNNKNSK